jgi:integrase
MRLAEAAGLMMKDLILDSPHPHVVVTLYPHRSLKTNASERIIPLSWCIVMAAHSGFQETLTVTFVFLVIRTYNDATATQQVLLLTSGLNLSLEMRRSSTD